MKNVSNLILLLLFTSFLFPSCSTENGISITKRHYRSGYHVDMGSGKSKTVASKKQANEANATQLAAKEVELNSTELSSSANDESVASKSSGKAETAEVIPVKVLKKSAKTDHSAKLANTTPNILQSSAKAFKKLAKSSEVSSAFKVDKNTASANDDGGGLLWTLIVILLVLWLLGLLTGTTLGGLIYIFLVVALIILLFKLIARI